MTSASRGPIERRPQDLARGRSALRAANGATVVGAGPMNSEPLAYRDEQDGKQSRPLCDHTEDVSMARVAVTPSPGFISIAVNDVERSSAFYEQHLGAVRDTFDWGPESAVFVGWPTFALSGARRPGQPDPSPETTSIQLWWRATDARRCTSRCVMPACRSCASRSTARSGGRSRWPIRTAIGSPSTSGTSPSSGRRLAEIASL